MNCNYAFLTATLPVMTRLYKRICWLFLKITNMNEKSQLWSLRREFRPSSQFFIFYAKSRGALPRQQLTHGGFAEFLDDNETELNIDGRNSTNI